MILAAHKFILMVVHSMVLISIGNQPIVGFPSIGVNVAFFQDVPLENRHQFSLGAVAYDTHINPISPLMQPKNGSLTTSSSPSFAPYPPGTKVAFIHFDLTR
jgi:hypothetical protein